MSISLPQFISLEFHYKIGNFDEIFNQYIFKKQYVIK